MAKATNESEELAKGQDTGLGLLGSSLGVGRTTHSFDHVPLAQAMSLISFGVSARTMGLRMRAIATAPTCLLSNVCRTR